MVEIPKKDVYQKDDYQFVWNNVIFLYQKDVYQFVFK